VNDQPKNAVMTKGDLERMGLGAIDRDRADVVKISQTAGGVAFASAMEVMDFAKLMSVSLQAVPPAFRNNPGMCLAVAFQAIEWRMSPFAVCNKAYVVNDRIAFESQLIHAVVEARAPIVGRLDCRYDGEGQTRTCTVTGTFFGNVERDYTTPQIQNIKTQNSPLWKADPDQQLWYYGSRSWARKWCPDVLMGIYSKEEAESIEDMRDAPQLPSLAARLAGKERPEEGFDHQNGTVDKELSNIAVDRPGLKVEKVAAETAPQPAAGARKGKRDTKVAAKPDKRTAAKKTEPAPAKKTTPAEPKKAEPAAPKATSAPEPPKEPKTASEYTAYARIWIAKVKSKDDLDARWDGERDMRDALSVPMSDRKALQELMAERFPITT